MIIFFGTKNAIAPLLKSKEKKDNLVFKKF